MTAHDLKSCFGDRKLQDFRLLSKLGKGTAVANEGNDALTVGELVSKRRGKRKQKGERPVDPLEKAGMDVICGDGKSVGG